MPVHRQLLRRISFHKFKGPRGYQLVYAPKHGDHAEFVFPLEQCFGVVKDNAIKGLLSLNKRLNLS